jgi:hypothetical protein
VSNDILMIQAGVRDGPELLVVGEECVAKEALRLGIFVMDGCLRSGRRQEKPAGTGRPRRFPDSRSDRHCGDWSAKEDGGEYGGRYDPCRQVSSGIQRDGGDQGASCGLGKKVRLRLTVGKPREPMDARVQSGRHEVAWATAACLPHGNKRPSTGRAPQILRSCSSRSGCSMHGVQYYRHLSYQLLCRVPTIFVSLRPIAGFPSFCLPSCLVSAPGCFWCNLFVVGPL